MTLGKYEVLEVCGLNCFSPVKLLIRLSFSNIHYVSLYLKMANCKISKLKEGSEL